MSAEHKAHVSEAKKQTVKELAKLMNKKTVMVASIKGLPAAQFQEIKKKLRASADVRVVKKNLMDFALEHSGNKELEHLVPYINSDFAILFSDMDAFALSGILASEKSPAKAKPGQITPIDIEVKAGPTDLLPGPDISALSAAGLQPKVEAGKIAIMKDKVIVKAGEVIAADKAAIMAKLNIVPFKIGLEPVAAFCNGKVYADIKIDKEAFLATFSEMYGRATPFAVSLAYVSSETLPFILGKAAAQETVLRRIVTGEPAPVAEVAQAAQVEEKKEEKKEEGAASLASLFG
jgi:large subunit ribosomal protein L10